MKTTPIRYCFTLPDGSQQVYNVLLDMQNLLLVNSTPENLPFWTNLDFFKCPNCPFTTRTHQHCPLAVNLVDIVNDFDGLISYENIHVEIVTQVRVVSQDTTVQKGVSSLMGLLIAASGCTHTNFFKSMVRFHLPLATEEETICRAASMYLLAQYFKKKLGLKADLDLKGLTEIYENIQTVNVSIAERLRAATKTDSSINAIILLDTYARAIPIVIEEYLEKIRYLFVPYFTINE